MAGVAGFDQTVVGHVFWTRRGTCADSEALGERAKIEVENELEELRIERRGQVLKVFDEWRSDKILAYDHVPSRAQLLSCKSETEASGVQSRYEEIVTPATEGVLDDVHVEGQHHRLILCQTLCQSGLP